MIFKGRKLKKEEYREKLAKRLAMSRKLLLTDKHYQQADSLIKDGAYEAYLETFKEKATKGKAKSKEND